MLAVRLPSYAGLEKGWQRCELLLLEMLQSSKPFDRKCTDDLMTELSEVRASGSLLSPVSVIAT